MPSLAGTAATGAAAVEATAAGEASHDSSICGSSIGGSSIRGSSSHGSKSRGNSSYESSSHGGSCTYVACILSNVSVLLSLLLLCCLSYRKVERQVKVPIENLTIFFLFLSKKFLPTSLGSSACCVKSLHHDPFPPAPTPCVLTEPVFWQKSPAGSWDRQTDGKNFVWFGNIERKLAKLSMTTFAYRSSS